MNPAIYRLLGGLSVAVLMSTAHTEPTASAPAVEADMPELAPVILPVQANEEVLHQELREVRDAMQNALNERQLDGLLEHVADNVVFTTMNGDRVIGKEGIRQYFMQMLEGPDAVVKNVTAKFEVESLSHLYHGDTAVAFGHSADRYELADGSAWTVNPQWSATLVRENNRWKIANFHYSVNMFDNPIINAQRKWLFGGGVAVTLLALGIGFVLGKRRARSA